MYKFHLYVEVSDKAALVKAIFAQRYDHLPRLVFADWLDEHNESELAELLRVSTQQSPDKNEQRRLYGYVRDQMAKIGQQLNSQYGISFLPSNAAIEDGRGNAYFISPRGIFVKPAADVNGGGRRQVEPDDLPEGILQAILLKLVGETINAGGWQNEEINHIESLTRRLKDLVNGIRRSNQIDPNSLEALIHTMEDMTVAFSGNVTGLNADFYYHIHSILNDLPDNYNPRLTKAANDLANRVGDANKKRQRQ